ncbi:MAG: hypothetical protein ABIP06_13180 [Pyrinomonadaceae bacterium]
MRLMNNKNSNEDFLNKIVYLMQTDKSEDAPQDAVKWAKNIFRTRAAAEPKKSFAQKVLAVLQMDLSPDKAAFGERSASATQVRQMLFGAGENSVDLRITETEKGFLNIHGQIVGEGFANCTVRLGESKTTANDLSEFKFTGISAGNCDLIFQTDKTEIVIENLNLR